MPRFLLEYLFSSCCYAGLGLSPAALSACCIEEDGAHRYIDDLLRLDAQRPADNAAELSTLGGQSLLEVNTPLIASEWASNLAFHPDPRFAAYIIEGISNGFRIGFARAAYASLSSSRRNMRSAYDNSSVVDDYIATELEKGRLLGPISHHNVPPAAVHLSPFGVIPKRNRPDKWRLIVDLSSPKHKSVNSGIDPLLCSLRYSSIDDAVAIVKRLGRGCLLAKLDLQSAYRVIPVHPVDRKLLAVTWKDNVYLDAALPFGLRSAPKIFSAVADALLFVMLKNGVGEAIHYLDDFLFLGRPHSSECNSFLSSALHTCENLGFPVAREKIEGPATVLSFLGITIDTQSSELRLPAEKLARISSELDKWLTRKCATKRELLSLIGLLHHAASIVRPGRSFLRRLIDLSTTASEFHHHIRLNVQSRSDIAWWQLFLSRWNGLSFIPTHSRECVLTSDASGSWGCGAYCDSNWFQFQWPSQAPSNIATKELIPILFAAAIWGSAWTSACVTFRCDNAAVVAVINKGSCKDPELMHLMRCLSFYAAYYNFSFQAVHIAGVKNIAADALSRGDLQKFFISLPQASPSPAAVPPAIVDMALLSKPDWTSQSWRMLFASSTHKA